MEESFHLHLAEVIGMIGGLVGIFGAIIGYLMKRAIFKEIDDLKEKKQDRTMCEQIESVACRDRDEIKADLKDGKREFKYLHRKIDMILFKMRIPFTRPNEDEETGGNIG